MAFYFSWLIAACLVFFNELAFQDKNKNRHGVYWHAKVWASYFEPSESSCLIPAYLSFHSPHIKQWVIHLNYGNVRGIKFYKQAQRATGGPSIVYNKQNVPILLPCALPTNVFTLNIDVNECIDVTDATSYEQHVENMLWCLWMRLWEGNTKSRMGGVVKGQWSGGRMDSFVFISSNHGKSLSSVDSFIKRSLRERYF